MTTLKRNPETRTGRRLETSYQIVGAMALRILEETFEGREAPDLLEFARQNPEAFGRLIVTMVGNIEETVRVISEAVDAVLEALASTCEAGGAR